LIIWFLSDYGGIVLSRRMSSPSENPESQPPSSPSEREAGWNESSDPVPAGSANASSSDSSPMDEDVDVLHHEKCALVGAVDKLKDELTKLRK
jgi:hypothetical protein